MDIREAIQKAGPGGKIRREEWDEGILATLEGVLKLTVGTNTEGWIPTLESLTADDWQVIEPEVIEVGDTINYKNHPLTEDICEREVVAVDKGFGKLCLKNKAGCLSMVTTNTCTLIRKGKPKHVFEGVTIHKDSNEGFSVWVPGQK